MKISNACFQDNEQIENRRGEKEEGEKGMEETQVHTFEKCYIGFCTPTRTEMDSKKKKMSRSMITMERRFWENARSVKLELLRRLVHFSAGID